MYIGIDAITIDKAYRLTRYTQKQLLRIFHPDEVARSQEHQEIAAYRLATRFAAKEAAYKAVSQYTTPEPFLTFCRNTYIYMNFVPHLALCTYPELSARVSMTHTKAGATAIVLLWHNGT